MPTVAGASAAGASSAAEKLFISIMVGGQGPDPYDAYRRLRSLAPVLYTHLGALVLTRYDDCDAALRHRSLGKTQEPLTAGRPVGTRDEPTRRAMARIRRSMLFSNPPDHTRLRRLVSSAFTVRHVEELEHAIRRHVEQLLDRLAAHSGEDFMTAVALPLPVNVIADLLGVPEADRENLTPLIHDVNALLEPQVSDEVLARAVVAHGDLSSYFGGLLGKKRRQPAADLLSRLAVGRTDDKLDDEEMIAAAILLFGAGFETTTGLLGNGLRALLENPSQLQLLREHPSLICSAVEEMLRFDPPVQLDGRITLEPATVAGVGLQAGQLVITLLGAANRDPGRYSEPERFDITRDEGPHLTFAAGLHFCLGAHLARLEAAIVFTRLLARFKTVELAGHPRPGNRLNPRGLVRLPIAVR
jgi:cytochrome P450